MSSRLSTYSALPEIKSPLYRIHNPDVVPPTEDLETLHAELKLMKQKSFERAKKAGDDIKLIEESLRRMREKEKGKAKALERIKREHERMFIIHSEESPMRMKPPPAPPTRFSSAAPSTSARSSADPRSAADELKKKKKRKRESESSDHERDHHVRPRKSTPSPKAVPPPVHKPPVPSAPKLSTDPKFALPHDRPLVFPRPLPLPRPTPLPLHPTLVQEDFSKSKPPTQTPVSTFYSSIEPWLRSIREEDVGWLEYTADEVEPYIMPPLGQHYSDVWMEQQRLQDAGLPGDPPNDSAVPGTAPPHPTWDPSTLADSDLPNEDRGHGPLTERVISALLTDTTTWKGVKAAEDAMEGRPGGGGAAAAKKEKMNARDLEARVRETMRAHGLLKEVQPDYSARVDDPIAAALRHAQVELRRVVATNKARKARLAAIARDRLGYQEYIECLEAMDKNIVSQYSRLQRRQRDARQAQRRRREKDQRRDGQRKDGKDSKESKDADDGPEPCPSAFGLGPDEDNVLVVDEQLTRLVQLRKDWVESVGVMFEKRDKEGPGRIRGMPTESIYQGIEEEVRAMRMGLPPPPSYVAFAADVKGKAKGREA
ncbi:hypothetical protein FISHEDRAFT_44014 [Fistulina hepatica ATCC 64428]|uniref:Histone acetyltransferases subunit 3 n=1 Tax=Fistulina hepatica ATCC 64428 TaxID=1128425 RepID=A0A0D7AB97_9AGAR|nr:hypothetical protein FISHEDRAFT_44014 [Fistulina hepatica ATCC 64428]